MSMATRIGQYGLKTGRPGIRSVGPLAFGPEGILFIADNAQAAIFAVDTGPGASPKEPRAIEVEGLDTRLAAFLGCSRDDLFIKDMAVHPVTQEVYLSVMRGSGDAAVPVLAKVDADGALTDVPLESVAFARATIEDAPGQDDPRLDIRVSQDAREGEPLEIPGGIKLRIAREPLRTVTVTDMAYVDGTLFVAGASNEEFSSTLRRIPFPFNGGASSNSLEIFHVSHGKYETASPIRSLVPYGGASEVLASYTCTPVVHFSLAGAAAGSQVKGRTVAELGFGNTPLDMVAFKKGGEEYLLVSNSRHPLIRIACRDIPGQAALTTPKEPVGVPRENLPQQGVTRMANLNGSYVAMLQQDESGSIDLRSYDTAAL